MAIEKVVTLTQQQTVLNKIKTYIDNKEVEIKISSEDGNQIVEKDDGLYVAATDLDNYVTKDELTVGIDISVVTQLPDSDISETTIYLIKDNDSEDNIYIQWMYINSQWANLGNTKVDLSDYATTEYVDSKLNYETASEEEVNELLAIFE